MREQRGVAPDVDLVEREGGLEKVSVAAVFLERGRRQGLRVAYVGMEGVETESTSSLVSSLAWRTVRRLKLGTRHAKIRKIHASKRFSSTGRPVDPPSRRRGRTDDRLGDGDGDLRVLDRLRVVDEVDRTYVSRPSLAVCAKNRERRPEERGWRVSGGTGEGAIVWR